MAAQLPDRVHIVACRSKSPKPYQHGNTVAFERGRTNGRLFSFSTAVSPFGMGWPLRNTTLTQQQRAGRKGAAPTGKKQIVTVVAHSRHSILRKASATVSNLLTVSCSYRITAPENATHLSPDRVACDGVESKHVFSGSLATARQLSS